MAIDTTKKIKQVTYNGTEIPLRGYDTSDATVTAGDMAEGVVAYGASGKVTGDVIVLGNGCGSEGILNEVAYIGTGLSVNASFKSSMLLRPSGAMFVAIPGSDLGDATAADVAKGKTFTSAAGLKVTGTAAGSSPRPVNISIKNTDFTEVWIGYVPFRKNMTQDTIAYGQTGIYAVEEGSEIVVMDTAFEGRQFNLSPSGGFITNEVSTSNVTAFIVDYSLNYETVELLLQ